MFFVSIEGEGDPTILADAVSQSTLVKFSPSLNYLRKDRIEKRSTIRFDQNRIKSAQDAYTRRNLRLQAVRTRLAEIGRRRKEIVTQMRRRQEREQQEYCVKMKEREFIVQYRRERLRYLPRSRLLKANLETDNLSTMASLITATWLRGKLRPLILSFLQTRVIDIIREGKEYKRMQKVMMDKSTIKVATNLILRLVKCDPIVSKLTRIYKAGRILLTALLLSGFGNDVMPETTQEEVTLLDRAELLAESLQEFFCQPSREQQLRIGENWILFSNSFGEWQQSSQEALVNDLESDYIGLESIVTNLNEGAKSVWRPHVRRHQERLKVALKRIAGDEAIKQLETKLENLRLARCTRETNKDPEENSFEETGNEKELWPIESVLGPNCSNIQIAHELVTDPKFDHRKLMKLKTGQSHNTAPEKVRTEANLFDLSEFIIMVKMQLLEMVHEQGEIAISLNERLEQSFLSEQMANGTFLPYPLLQFLAECMSKICAPARDYQIASLITETTSESKSIQEVCVELKNIMILMHEDLSNFGLKIVRPRVVNIIISYEREWYAKEVLSKPVPIAQYLTKSIFRSNEASYNEKKPLLKIYAVILDGLMAMMGFPADHVVNSNIQVPSIEAHEFYVLDRARIRRISYQLDLITKLSAIGLALKTLGTADWSESLARLCILAIESEDNSLNIENIKHETIRNVDQNSMRSSVQDAVERILQGSDPVVVLLRRRISSLLRQTLLDDSVNVMNKPISILIRNGIAEPLYSHFNDVVNELLRTYRLHRSVLAPVYYKFIQ